MGVDAIIGPNGEPLVGPGGEPATSLNCCCGDVEIGICAYCARVNGVNYAAPVQYLLTIPGGEFVGEYSATGAPATVYHIPQTTSIVTLTDPLGPFCCWLGSTVLGTLCDGTNLRATVHISNIQQSPLQPSRYINAGFGGSSFGALCSIFEGTTMAEVDDFDLLCMETYEVEVERREPAPNPSSFYCASLDAVIKNTQIIGFAGTYRLEPYAGP